MEGEPRFVWISAMERASVASVTMPHVHIICCQWCSDHLTKADLAAAEDDYRYEVLKNLTKD